MTEPKRYRKSIVERLRQRIFLTVFLFTRGCTLGVRALVPGADGTVLLVRHTYTSGWYLPGGGVEPGETAREALEKELREEASIRLTGPVQLAGILLNRKASRRDHVAYYICPHWEEIAPFVPTREIAEMRFFPMTDLPDDTTPSTRRRIEAFLADAVPGEIW